jgi:hypothetical protein
MRRLFLVLAALTLTAGCDSSRDNTPTGPSTTGPIVLTGQLLASNEVPAVTNAESGARGTVTITIETPRDAAGNPTAGGTVTFAIQLTNFPPGTAAILAHIHTGPATAPGPVLVDTGLSPTAPLLLGDGTASVALTGRSITLAQVTQILANPNGYYFNVHTPLNPAGAVRGQLVRP